MAIIVLVVVRLINLVQQAVVRDSLVEEVDEVSDE